MRLKASFIHCETGSPRLRAVTWPGCGLGRGVARLGHGVDRLCHCVDRLYHGVDRLCPGVAGVWAYCTGL